MPYTLPELNALTTLLQRTPLNPAEVLWLNGLLDRLRAAVPPAPPPPLPTPVQGETPHEQ